MGEYIPYYLTFIEKSEALIGFLTVVRKVWVCVVEPKDSKRPCPTLVLIEKLCGPLQDKTGRQKKSKETAREMLHWRGHGKDRRVALDSCILCHQPLDSLCSGPQPWAGHLLKRVWHSKYACVVTLQYLSSSQEPFPRILLCKQVSWLWDASKSRILSYHYQPTTAQSLTGSDHPFGFFSYFSDSSESPPLQSSGICK